MRERERERERVLPVYLLSVILNVLSLQRPRKIGAKYTGDNFAPDEYIQANLSFDYEGKRDRWNGYNPEEHQKVYEQFEKLEAVCINPLLHMSTSNLTANKDMMSKIWTNGDSVILFIRKHRGKRRNCSL